MRRAQLGAFADILRAMIRELGLVSTTRVMRHVIGARLRREPFAHLGPATDDRERKTRAQAADLVLLDRALREVTGDDALALALCRDAVVAGGLRFLSAMIPPLPATGLGTFATELAGRFFNAEGDARADADDQSFDFTVRRCLFVELLGAVDASHLAPLFCSVDEVYFARDDQPLRLTRTKTLATGGDCCDFHFERR
jgi:hypothetical protein